MSTSEQDLWVESGRGQMLFKERQCREKPVSLWLKRTKHFFTVTKNQDFGLFPKGRGNFHLKWYIACFYISIHWISGSKLRLSLWNLQPAFYPVAALAVCTFHQSWELAFFSKKLSQFTKKWISKIIDKQFLRQFAEKAIWCDNL